LVFAEAHADLLRAGIISNTQSGEVEKQEQVPTIRGQKEMGVANREGTKMNKPAFAQQLELLEITS
jgi:hypothetical protein